MILIAKTTSTQHNVFVSYSHTNKPFVSNLIKDLSAKGISVWVDTSQLKPGTTMDWQKAIRDAIKSVQIVICAASPSFSQSPYTQAELDIANYYKRVIIPVWADGDEWIECIPWSMSRAQYTDMRKSNYARGLEELIE